MTAVGVDADGNETPIASLKIEEFLSTNAYPLLAFIFFAENSSDLQSKFIQLKASETAAFHPEQLYGQSTMEIYHNVLNVIAYRLQKYPNATLTLTGCNADVGMEKGNTSLSQHRAETIRDYFTKVWNIPETHIQIESRSLPAKPSNPKTPLGQEENRRVEITCNIPEVLDVFISYDTARVSTPPLIRYKLSASSPQGIDHWKLGLTQSQRFLTGFTDPGTPPASVDWDLENNQATVPHYGGDVHSDFEVTESTGKTCEKSFDLLTNIVTLRQKKAENLEDYKIERYSLVLFDFARSTMTDAQSRIIDLIKSNITPASQLTIEGYTDKTGSHEGNAKLATSRATSTRDALARPDATVRGIGDRRLLYSNDTPEGRFYCRTVQIEVKTPVK
jgi:outer membrane protein OmpA-like peptidoglycan-associated protein